MFTLELNIFALCYAGVAEILCQLSCVPFKMVRHLSVDDQS